MEHFNKENNVLIQALFLWEPWQHIIFSLGFWFFCKHFSVSVCYGCSHFLEDDIHILNPTSKAVISLVVTEPRNQHSDFSLMGTKELNPSHGNTPSPNVQNACGQFYPTLYSSFFWNTGNRYIFALLIQSKRVVAQNQNITEPLCTFNLMKT